MECVRKKKQQHKEAWVWASIHAIPIPIHIPIPIPIPDPIPIPSLSDAAAYQFWHSKLLCITLQLLHTAANSADQRKAVKSLMAK